MSKVLDQVKGKSLIIKMDLKIIDKDEQKIGLILEELASINSPWETQDTLDSVPNIWVHFCLESGA